MDISDYGGNEYIIFITNFLYPPTDDGREGSGGGNVLAVFNFDSSDGSSSLNNWSRYDIGGEDVCSQFTAHDGSMYFICTYASNMGGARRYPFLV
jgi:hypothetical protein